MDFRLEAGENAKLILSQWGESLTQVLESMTDQRPEMQCQSVTGTLSEAAAAMGAGPEADLLWWEQPFQVSPEMMVWVAAPQGTWEYTGTLTLKAAGLESVESGEAKNTWFEILGQSLSAMARSIGSLLGREVTCENGVERSPALEPGEWTSVSLQFGDRALAPLLVALSPKLITAITVPPAAAPPEPQEVAIERIAPPPDPEAPRSRTMDLLLDVDLPVSISFGKAQLPMKDVLKLTTGSIVELNRGVSEQVEVLVNQCLIARGEVVVVDGNYGVRIQEIASRQDRLRTLR
jgi:flagellar motor switch protein FliN/FliY